MITKEHTLQLHVSTGECMVREITRLIATEPVELYIRRAEKYDRARELYILNLVKTDIQKKLNQAAVKGDEYFKLKIHRIPLQVLADNITVGIGADGFIGEAMKHVVPVYKGLTIN